MNQADQKAGSATVSVHSVDKGELEVWRNNEASPFICRAALPFSAPARKPRERLVDPPRLHC